MKAIALILVSCIMTGPVLAQCPKPVIHLEKGEQAPCSGYLFSPQKELELRIKNEEYKVLLEQSKIYIQQTELYRKELEVTEQIINKEQAKTEVWRKAAEDSTARYIKLEEARTTRDWIFLVSGIGLTVLSGWAIGQAAK